ncbi:MAG: ZIP family metal transporter [Desulfovibrionaceae bacterium]
MDIVLSPVIESLIAGISSWLAITAGAAIIFLRREFSRHTQDIMLGGAGGMMLGAAFWGLLTPSMDLSAPLGLWAFGPPLIGLALGALFLRGLDKVLPHLHGLSNTQEGLSTTWRRSILLVTAMALHHIPEGLAIGVGYGAAGVVEASISHSSAFVLTLSIILQNVPEGLVVSTALRAEGMSAKKSFFYGMLSGITAPLGAVPGALAAGLMTHILPIALAFAAGAMIYVVVEEVIPEANASGNGNSATLACITGVALVIILDSLLK